jgi:UPF0755 protein
LLLVAAGAWLMFDRYQSFLNTPLNLPESGFHLQVERGASVRSVISNLDQQGMTHADWRWRVLNRLQPLTIKAGEYALEPGLNPVALLQLLSSGAVVRYRFTIVEGWTFGQLLAALSKDPVLEQSIPGLDGNLLILRAIEAGVDHPEVWFLPETYLYVRGDSDLDILRRAHQGMLVELETAWSGREDDLPLASAYELLTLASIVEKESALDAERADIAGVFVRRLIEGWRLETDPSVIYGLGDRYDGNIRRRDLDTDTPYNTYTRFGLPPTPIAMPGKSALLAAASPAPGTAMFFVASGTGGHVFSDTLDEHNAAVRKMLRIKP